MTNKRFISNELCRAYFFKMQGTKMLPWNDVKHVLLVYTNGIHHGHVFYSPVVLAVSFLSFSVLGSLTNKRSVVIVQLASMVTGSNPAPCVLVKMCWSSHASEAPWALAFYPSPICKPSMPRQSLSQSLHGGCHPISFNQRFLNEWFYWECDCSFCLLSLRLFSRINSPDLHDF